mmetsp:Transcript_109002/g.274295  ORF Transcript_109002/g.274295 Transcript_109002/m.274295 type:complete len:214 (-) Transcript_109002:392-1033(-)
MRGDDVEAEDERLKHSDNESRCVSNPEGAQLDVDVTKAIVGKRLEVRDEAVEDAHTRVHIVLVKLLLHSRIQLEVLRCSARGFSCRCDVASAIDLKFLADPRRALRASRRRRTGAAPGRLLLLLHIIIGLEDGIIRLRRAIVRNVGQAEDVTPTLLLELGGELTRSIQLLERGNRDPHGACEELRTGRLRAEASMQREEDTKRHEGESRGIVG